MQVLIVPCDIGVSVLWGLFPTEEWTFVCFHGNFTYVHPSKTFSCFHGNEIFYIRILTVICFHGNTRLVQNSKFRIAVYLKKWLPQLIVAGSRGGGPGQAGGMGRSGRKDVPENMARL